MEDNMKYLDCYAYNVVTGKDGVKHAHIHGYCFFDDEEYQCVEGTFCYVPVTEFISTEQVHDAFYNVKQYQGVVSKEDAVDFYKDCKELRLDCVTADTPDGKYVDY